MRSKTLEELKTNISKINNNKKETIITNIERLKSKMCSVEDPQEISRLNDLIELQNVELDKLKKIKKSDIDAIAKERFDKLNK